MPEVAKTSLKPGYVDYQDIDVPKKTLNSHRYGYILCQSGECNYGSILLFYFLLKRFPNDESLRTTLVESQKISWERCVRNARVLNKDTASQAALLDICQEKVSEYQTIGTAQKTKRTRWAE